MNTREQDNTTLPFDGSYRTDDIIVLCLQVSLCFIAVSAHAGTIAFTLMSKEAKNTASYIIASISIAEGMLSLYLGIWFPLTFLLQQPLETKEAMFTAVIFFGASDNFDILLSINRYVATVKPLLYPAVFSPMRVKIYVVAMLTTACVCCIPYGVPGCRLMMDYAMYHITYEHTTCGKIIEFGSEVFATGALFATILNVLTFRKLRQSTKAISKSIKHKESKRRVQREITFFVQSCVTSTTTSLTVISVDYVSLLFSDKWGLYITTNLFPLFLLAVDGVTVLLLNRSIRERLLGKLCIGNSGRKPQNKSMDSLSKVSSAWK